MKKNYLKTLLKNAKEISLNHRLLKIAIVSCISFLSIINSSFGQNTNCPLFTNGTWSNGGGASSVQNIGNAYDGDYNNVATLLGGALVTNVTLNFDLTKPANPGDTIRSLFSIPILNFFNAGSLANITVTGYSGLGATGATTGSGSGSLVGFFIQIGTSTVDFIPTAGTQSIKIDFNGISIGSQVNFYLNELVVNPGKPAITASSASVCSPVTSTITVTKATAAGNTTVLNLYNASGTVVATHSYTAPAGGGTNTLTYITPALTSSTTYSANESMFNCTTSSFYNPQYSPSATAAVTVTVDPAMSVAFSNGCTGIFPSKPTIKATPSGGTSGYSYAWTASNGGTISANGNTQAVTIGSNGTYSVLVTDAVGCTYTAGLFVSGYSSSSTTCSTILPVTLTSFTGVEQNGAVILNWKTVTEINNKGFQVQKSIDGGNTFKPMGDFVSTQAPNGNSNVGYTYSFIDNSPINGNNYYRLQQVDFDGNIKLYDIILVKVGNGTSLKTVRVFPNPAHSFLNIETTTGGTYHLELYSIDGRKVLAQKVQTISGVFSVNIPGVISSGTYQLKIIDDKNSSSVSKIIIQ